MATITKSPLTNEEIGKKFVSSFELVNYAIKLAENMIKTGRDARVKSDIQNRAMLVVEEILEGKDYFDEVKGAEGADPLADDLEGIFAPNLVYDELGDKSKHRAMQVYDQEEYAQIN